MKVTGRRLAWAATILVIGGLFAVWGLSSRMENQKARADFEWFSTLGFVDVKECPYVRIATGEGNQLEGNATNYFSGFLFSTNASNFKIFTLDLLTAVAPHTRPTFEVLDLRKEASLRVQSLRKAPAKEDLWNRFGAQMPEQIKVFTMAWACWRQGLTPEALDLYEEARRLPLRQVRQHSNETFRQSVQKVLQRIKDKWAKMISTDGRKEATSLRDSIEKHVAHALMWRAVADFENISISRPELLDKFEVILKHYPRSEHQQRANAMVAMLKLMIAEDQEHARNAPKDLFIPPIEEQVRELIFRLRDQNGHQYSQPGACDIFEDGRGFTNTPAHQLVKLGYAAVPQLIPALDSGTLTRSVGYHRDFYFSHTVLTVGNCAALILHRISGRAFRSGSMSKNGEASAERKAAETWWAEFQKKGEKQMLLEAVAAASDDAPDQAELLCQKYPNEATDALIFGAGATTNSWIRTRLIEQMAKLGSRSGVEFLTRELLEGPTVQSRVAAAYGLRQHDRRAALTAMIREWRELREPTNEDDDGCEQLIEFLMSCDSVESISALASNLGQRPAEIRLKVIQTIGEPDGGTFDHEIEKPSAATLEIIEKCLVASLEDIKERMGASGSRNGKSYSNPRICDMAAWFLAERWPDRYTFDISGSLRIRERERMDCMNTWRKMHDLPAIPLPQVQLVRVDRREATKVTIIEWPADSVEPERSLANRIAKLKNKRLRPHDLTLLLSYFASHSQSGVAGLELKATKDEDLTGVRLLIRLLPGSYPTKGQGWAVQERVALGGKSLDGSSGGGTLDAYGEVGQWHDFEEAVKQAIAGEADTPFEISVQIKVNESK